MAEKAGEQVSAASGEEQVAAPLPVSKGESRSSSSKPSSPSTAAPSATSPGAGGGSWWGSWIDTAKSKSASVLEAVKKDLDELTSAVKTEATNAGSALADTLKFQEPESTANTVKKSLSSFFGQVSEVLNPSLTEDDDAEAILITKDGSVTLTGFHKHLAELQANDDIYLIEPDLELAEKYQRWMDVVDQGQFTQHRLDKQLASSQILAEKYEELVPKQVTHMNFWQRYLFKRALLEDALANAELAERRAQQAAHSNVAVSPRKTIIQTEQPKRVVADDDEGAEEGSVEAVAVAAVPESPVKETVVVAVAAAGTASGEEPMASIDEELSKLAENELKWGHADFTCNDVELSEEEQARLLAEYEQEIQERERKTVQKKSPTAAATTKGQQKQQQGGKQAGKGQQAGKSTDSKGPGKNQPQSKGQQQQKGKGNAAQKGGAVGKTETKPAPTKDDSDESWEKDFDVDE